MPNKNGIHVAPYAFKRGENDYWPAIAVFAFDGNGEEVQLFYAEPGFGNGLGRPRFGTEHEALEDAKQISAAHFDGSGRLMLVYRGQVYPSNLL